MEYNIAKYSYTKGSRFANVTITGDKIKDNHGHYKFPCVCNCGAKALLTKRQLLGRVATKSKYCKKCRPVTWKRPSKIQSYLLPELGMKFIQGKLEKENYNAKMVDEPKDI